MKDIIREFVEEWKKNYIAYWNELADKAEEIQKDEKKEYEEQEKEIKSIIGKGYFLPFIWGYMREEVSKDAEREGERKYRQFVNRVTAKGGKILDQAKLHIGNDGSVNGWVACENGDVWVETIYAGGYNEHIIVNVKHGQRLHYRVLVK